MHSPGSTRCLLRAACRRKGQRGNNTPSLAPGAEKLFSLIRRMSLADRATREQAPVSFWEGKLCSHVVRSLWKTPGLMSNEHEVSLSRLKVFFGEMSMRIWYHFSIEVSLFLLLSCMRTVCIFWKLTPCRSHHLQKYCLPFCGCLFFLLMVSFARHVLKQNSNLKKVHAPQYSWQHYLQ